MGEDGLSRDNRLRAGVSRRKVLQGLAAGAGLALLNPSQVWAATGRTSHAERVVRRADLLAPGSRPDPSNPEGIDLLPQVEHVIIYMQENHSFDNYFGLLGRGDGLTVGAGGLPTNTNPDLNGQPVPMFHATSLCDTTPGASQSWNATHISIDGGKMDGFVRAAKGGNGSMMYWDGKDLPFYYGLAETFPICDRWFGSAPCQTFPNRRFLQAATSVGIVSTSIPEVVATPDAPNGVIWDRLNDHGITWNDYAIDLADILLFPNFAGKNGSHVKKFQDFLDDCARGSLPQVSIISPGDKTYTEESPADVQNGEAYSSSIINAVMHSPNWAKTVMFFCYDEHGGFYDHVAPPAAVKPDDIAPRITVPPDQPGAFDIYGPRVPGFVISPFAKADYVSHVVHDHTSILKFIESKFNLGAMTYRDANADNLMDTLDFANPSFREPPKLPAPGIPATGSACQPLPLPATKGNPNPVTTTTTTAATTTSPPTTSGATTAGVAPGTNGAGGPGTTGAGAEPVSGIGTTPSSPTLARTGSNTAMLATVGGAATLAGVAAVVAGRRVERAAAGADNGCEPDEN